MDAYPFSKKQCALVLDYKDAGAVLLRHHYHSCGGDGIPGPVLQKLKDGASPLECSHDAGLEEILSQAGLLDIGRAMDVLLGAGISGMAYHECFTGTADPSQGFGPRERLVFDRQPFLCLLPDRKISYFTPAYASYTELIYEYERRLKAMPGAGFDAKRRIMDVTGFYER